MPATLLQRPHVQTAAAVAGAIAIAALLTTALHARVSAQDIPLARTPIPVATQRFTTEQRYEREQRFLGLVQAAARSQIGFEVPGAIASIDVHEGETVRAGDPIASLETSALQARRDAAAATAQRVAAELELARSRTRRQEPLKDSGAISAQTFDETRLAEKALESALASALAQLRALDIDIEKSVLRAPYAARIGRQLLDRGAVTRPGTAVFTLVSAAEREAHVGVAVEQLPALETGRLYTLEWRDEAIEATLRGVRPDVNPVSMTVSAIFDLPSGVDAHDGEPVALRLPRVEHEVGGWLPLSALLEGERGVWTVLALRERDDGSVALREVVEVLHVSSDEAYVRGSLNTGDQVITDGVHRIAPGTRVQALPAVATALGGKR